MGPRAFQRVAPSASRGREPSDAAQAMRRRRCGPGVHKDGCLESLVEIGSARALPPSAQSSAPPGGPDRGARAAGLWRCLEGRSRQCWADVVAAKVAGEVRLMRDRAGEVGAHDAVVHAARRLVVHRRVFQVERLLDACMGRELPRMDSYTTQRPHLKAAQLGCSRPSAQALRTRRAPCMTAGRLLLPGLVPVAMSL